MDGLSDYCRSFCESSFFSFLIETSFTKSGHLISLPLNENFFWQVAFQAHIAHIVLLEAIVIHLVPYLRLIFRTNVLLNSAVLYIIMIF